MKNLIIDGNNLVHRAYWVSNSRGGVNHLSIVLTSIKSYVEKFEPTKIYCAWDMRKSSEVAFRKEGDSVYKETRDNEYNAQVHELTSVIENLFESLGIINVYPKRGEADDIIFWLSKKLPGENVIISADTDLLQLVSAETKVFSPIKKILFDIPTMYEKYGMHPNRFCEYKCIVGDKSDNIEGVEGFGNKRALAIIKGEKTLTQEQQDIVDKNRELIDLDNSHNEMWVDEYKFYDSQIPDAEFEPNFKTFKNICEKFNLNGILKQENKWHDVFFMKSVLNNTISKLFALIFIMLTAVPALMLGQEESPIIPVGTLIASPTQVQAGTHPTLSWNVIVPEAVSDIVSIENTGTVRADRCVFADVRVLGASVKRVWKNWRDKVVHWEWVPTQGRVSQNGGSSKSFFFDTNDRINPNKIVWSTKLASGDTLDFSGRYVRHDGYWSSTFDSRSVSQNVRALRNGDVPPTTTPLYQQPSIESFLLPFLDSEGRIKIGSRDVIYLVELTHTDVSSSGFDLQDLAFLVSFYEEVETDVGSIDCSRNLTDEEDTALKQNNGHGNNYDGVDSSNPGKSPKKLNDSDPNIDDETRRRGRRRR